MNKKKYITPVVLIEDMEIADIMKHNSWTETENNIGIYTNDKTPPLNNNPTKEADSKESDWSFDYSLDIDW